jgi:3-dehydroquinate dehydratase II
MTGAILILNGPNLNMLGKREPSIYGADTLADIEKQCAVLAKNHGFVLDFRQSNAEGELVTWVQNASQDAGIKGVIVNAGAYTHTSVALHDSLRLLSCPIVEVHLSNPMAREAFRHISYVAPLAFACVSGLGAYGYTVAMEALIRKLIN